MSERIEILSTLAGQTPQFTVNASAASVSFTSPAPTNGVGYVLYNAFNFSVFNATDNFRVLSMGIVFPEQFCFATTAAGPCIVAPGYIDTLAQHALLTEFGNFGVFLPLESYDFPLDVYVDMTNKQYTGNNFQLFIAPQFTRKVSMLNVPANVNGVAWGTQYALIYLKVLHTKALVA